MAKRSGGIEDMQHIVTVTGKGGRFKCEILAQSSKEALRIEKRVREEGVWEPRDGVRYQHLSPKRVGAVKIRPAHPRTPPRAHGGLTDAEV